MSDLKQQTEQLLKYLERADAKQAQLMQTMAEKAHITAKSTQIETPEPLIAELDELQSDLPTTTTEPAVEFDIWEALAYDLALATTDNSTIAKAYHITDTQLSTLLANPYFTKLLNSKKAELRDLGGDADFTAKMRLIASKATPFFLKRLTSMHTADKDFHAMFRTVVELAKLLPQPADKKDNSAMQASVVFNIHGVPGLDHLSANSQPATTNAYANPPVQNKVVDGTYTDIALSGELKEL